MSYRRILFLGQFVAAIVLPTWVLVGRGLLGDDLGLTFLVYLVACPVLAVSMLAVSAVISARRSARLTRTVSPADAVVLSAWYAAIIAYGFFSLTALAVLIVLLAVGGFWYAVVALFRETRDRWRGLVAGVNAAARPPQGSSPAGSAGDGATPRVVILEPGDPGPRFPA